MIFTTCVRCGETCSGKSLDSIDFCKACMGESPKQDSSRKDRRRWIFEQVALSAVIHNDAHWDFTGFEQAAANCAEKIISAADEFAEKEIEK